MSKAGGYQNFNVDPERFSVGERVMYSDPTRGKMKLSQPRYRTRRGTVTKLGSKKVRIRLDSGLEKWVAAHNLSSLEGMEE